MRKLSLIAAVAAVALPTGALAQTSPPANPSQQCRAQRAAMGAATFAQLYGTHAARRNAFGRCVAKLAREQRAERRRAEAACRDERAANPAAFATKYGTGHNRRNAFGRCVSSAARALADARQAATINAAQACRAERAAMGTEKFADTYGTNRNKRNAFGRCVAQHAPPSA